MALALNISMLCYGQDYLNDFRKVNAYFFDTESYEVDINIKVFDHSKNNALISSIRYEFKKNGKSIFYTMRGINMLVNEKYALTIRDDQRLIHLVHKNASDNKKDKIDFSTEAVFESIDSVAFIGNENGNLLYKLHDYDGYISEVYAYIDDSNYRLNKLRYFYSDYQDNNIYYEVVILYDNWNDGPVFKSNDFSERRYVRKTKNGYETTLEYSDYTLIVDNTIIEEH